MTNDELFYVLIILIAFFGYRMVKISRYQEKVETILEAKFLMLALRNEEYVEYIKKIIDIVYEKGEMPPERREEHIKIKETIDNNVESAGSAYIAEMKKLLPYRTSKMKYNNWKEAKSYATQLFKAYKQGK